MKHNLAIEFHINADLVDGKLVTDVTWGFDPVLRPKGKTFEYPSEMVHVMNVAGRVLKEVMGVTESFKKMEGLGFSGIRFRETTQ